MREPETACIASVSHDGRGIADLSGKKVFVADALEGEEVRFVRRKRRRNYDEAQLLEVLSASPKRVQPRCAVFGVCGGCTLQHVAGSEQRRIKQRALADALESIGQLAPLRWLPPIHDSPWKYRRRARLAVKDVAGKGRVLVGFRERHAPLVTDMHRCEVLARPVDSLIEPLSELIGRLSIRGRLPQIEVACADNATALVFRVLDPPNDSDLVQLRSFGQGHGLRIYLQPGRLDSISLVYPEGPLPPLSYRLPDFDVTIEFEAADFVQVNGPVNRRLVATALELLQPAKEDRILDLFCGIGNFALPLARTCGYVSGVENEQSLVDRATANAAQNGIRAIEFRRADLSRIDGKERWLADGWTGVLLDPPRSGAPEVVRHIRSIAPSKIVYVSCHPGTLARDLRELELRGYRLSAAGIVDMFPHTRHVESIALLHKQ
ncbi:MAG: 23S rRNA (uracil(1939)-C(5))-methyltransferase RlmD [Woeseia sp.]